MLESSKTWRVSELLNITTEFLEERQFENARLNVERLLSHALDLKRIDLYLNYDRPLDPGELARFREFVKRRLQHEPLQYIVGETEFMSIPLKVKPGVLIPRPETEVLVETVIEKCKDNFSEKESVALLDIGTGSGCIAIALAKHIEKARITAIDISDEAIAITRENCRLNNAEDRVEIKQCDVWTEPVFESSRKFDFIISNPPYVSPQEFENLPEEIRNYEPENALQDRGNGLSFFGRISELGGQILNPGGHTAVEVGLGQARNVAELFLQNGFSKMEIIEDLNEIERVVCCQY